MDHVEDEPDVTDTRPGESGISTRSPANASVVSPEPAAVELPAVPAAFEVVAGPFGRGTVLKPIVASSLSSPVMRNIWERVSTSTDCCEGGCMATRFGLAPFGTVGAHPCAMLQGPCVGMRPCCA